MLQARIIGPEEADFYNDFVERHPKGHFLQSWEWGQVKSLTDWQPLPLVLEDEGRMVASIMLLKRRLPIPGVNRCILYSPRGPVADIHDKKILKELFAAVRQVAKKEGAIFLKVDPDVPAADDEFIQVLQANGFLRSTSSEGFDGVQPTFVFRLDISLTEEELMANFHQKWRYNSRLAERKGITVREAENKEDLRKFYQVLKETAERDHFIIRGYEYFEKIWNEMMPELARFFIVEYEGKVVAGSLAMIMGDKAWYLYGASSNSYRNVMPNYLMQWQMIKWAKANNCILYDFRGVSGDLNEDNPLYGLYRFKKGFGGEFTEFVGDWDTVYSSSYYWLWTRVLPLYQKESRRLVRIKHRLGR
ncbi:MAG: lipid II:glycine glycyltransferase FemX [Methylocystaceae bacterium]